MARLDWILPSRKTTRKAGKMDAPSTTPHDAVFKQFLMHAETARDFWRYICQWNYENFVTSTRFI